MACSYTYQVTDYSWLQITQIKGGLYSIDMDTSEVLPELYQATVQISNEFDTVTRTFEIEVIACPCTSVNDETQTSFTYEIASSGTL